ncbi:MAG TPA: hypothetical protein VL463_03960 [Kofleriaceae bacterium]|nr:hypothetical protein [Kofleriaceae bacterium]
MKRAALIFLAACGSSAMPASPDAPAAAPPDASSIDAPIAAIDAAPSSPDASVSVPLAGFGDLTGECGILGVADLTGTSPELHRDTLTFARAYVDPDDRDLLTPDGKRLISTPNAGGSSIASETFALEELARCELATLLKTETEIVYDTPGKITDFEVSIDGHKIGVSVTRAETYPLGQTYQLSTATTLITRKLNDIKTSSADVSAGDKWDKQILAILAYDTQAADTMAQAWTMLDASTKADTIVIITTTEGDDTFIY